MHSKEILDWGFKLKNIEKFLSNIEYVCYSKSCRAQSHSLHSLVLYNIGLKSEKSVIHQILWVSLELTQTPSAKGLREGTKGSDRIKSSNPFLQAVASAEETLEDRNTKTWAQSSGMEDVWRCSQHPLLPPPSPPPHSPTLIELFVSPPVIVVLAPISYSTLPPWQKSVCIPTSQCAYI